MTTAIRKLTTIRILTTMNRTDSRSYTVRVYRGLLQSAPAGASGSLLGEGWTDNTTPCVSNMIIPCVLVIYIFYSIFSILGRLVN